MYYPHIALFRIFYMQVMKVLAFCMEQSDYFCDSKLQVDIKIHILSYSGVKDKFSTQLLQISPMWALILNASVSGKRKYWVLCLNHVHTFYGFADWQQHSGQRCLRKGVLQFYLSSESELLAGVIYREDIWRQTFTACICMNLLVIFMYKYSMHKQSES